MKATRSFLHFSVLFTACLLGHLPLSETNDVPETSKDLCCVRTDPCRVYFREILFPHHSFISPPKFTWKRGNASDEGSQQGTLSLHAAGRAFSSMLALSFCIFEVSFLSLLLDVAS